MKRRIPWIGAAAGCLAAAVLMSAVPAHGQIRLWRFDVSLDGAQERPNPVPTPGTGSAVVWLDEIAMTIDVFGTFENLLSPTVANPAGRAHIHGPATPEQFAGVLIGLTADGGVTSGTFTTGGPIPISQTNMDHVLNGLTYINIHSELYPAGEIRGNLLDPIFIPEPSTALLVLIGLSLAALRIRRRVA